MRLLVKLHRSSSKLIPPTLKQASHLRPHLRELLPPYRVANNAKKIIVGSTPICSASKSAQRFLLDS
ncbi:uncharacterized protein PHALS_15427 [Plasmopara halstedii]|uniref:Uncharacterized protein n=1 Tax=Plasmopara halstedii TaxID=4781 RepID=A0A0P1AGA6_PLAHL|nr:uncharacterized protein PHALS_15427 [Plasmopara halstedii]CEG40138.1 hypothetical protein PHALS_15427 [Plasmopara halstedii]|eukprot:XP_024576507.1 hypothetical protein PHALS_15427 [Plasmopara halstedii]